MPYSAPEREHQAGSWRLLYELAQLPARAQPITVASPGGLVYSGRCILTGATINNSGAAGGGVLLFDGQDANGPLLLAVGFGATANVAVPVAGQGLLCESGVFASSSGFTGRASAWIIPLWHYPRTQPGE